MSLEQKLTLLLERWQDLGILLSPLSYAQIQQLKARLSECLVYNKSHIFPLKLFVYQACRNDDVDILYPYENCLQLEQVILHGFHYWQRFQHVLRKETIRNQMFLQKAFAQCMYHQEQKIKSVHTLLHTKLPTAVCDHLGRLMYGRRWKCFQVFYHRKHWIGVAVGFAMNIDRCNVLQSTLGKNIRRLYGDRWIQV